MGNTINLLAPSTVIKKRNVSKFYGQLVAAGCVFAVVLTSAVYTGYFVVNTKLNKELDSLHNEIQAMGSTAGHAAAAGALKTRLGETGNEVGRLRSQRPRLSEYMDELLKITPQTVRITNLELFSNPFKATIQGSVDSHTAVAQFGTNLQRSKLYKDSIIDLSETKLREEMTANNGIGNNRTGNNGTGNQISGENVVRDKIVNFVISVSSEAKGDTQQ